MIYTRYKHYIIGNFNNTYNLFNNKWSIYDLDNNIIISKGTIYECIEFINRYIETNKILKELERN